jgi:hypothetical protein
MHDRLTHSFSAREESQFFHPLDPAQADYEPLRTGLEGCEYAYARTSLKVTAGCPERHIEIVTKWPGEPPKLVILTTEGHETSVIRPEVARAMVRPCMGEIPIPVEAFGQAKSTLETAGV